jgi:hypothetical protein
MPQIGSAVALSLGQSASVPTQLANAQVIQGVGLQNLSGFALQVSFGAFQMWIPPFCSATMPQSQLSTVGIVPVNVGSPAGAGLNYVLPTYYLPGDDMPPPGALVASPLPVDIVSVAAGAIFPVELTEGLSPTYSAGGFIDISAGANTDVVQIFGNGGSVIRMSRIEVSGYCTSGKLLGAVQLVQRSSNPTGGTHTDMTIVPNDPADAASNATVFAYTAEPSNPGTLVGVVRESSLVLPASTLTAPPTDRVLWDWMASPGRKRPTINELLSPFLGINLNGASIAGGVLIVSLEWTEDPV